MAARGLRGARDGLRWHRIEVAPGRDHWSSALPMLRAAAASGLRVIWDICHYGWPDDLDIWSEAFVERFARFHGGGTIPLGHHAYRPSPVHPHRLRPNIS